MFPVGLTDERNFTGLSYANSGVQFADPVIKSKVRMILHPAVITDMVVTMIRVGVSVFITLLVVGNEDTPFTSGGNFEKVE